MHAYKRERWSNSFKEKSGSQVYKTCSHFVTSQLCFSILCNLIFLNLSVFYAICFSKNGNAFASLKKKEIFLTCIALIKHDLDSLPLRTIDWFPGIFTHFHRVGYFLSTDHLWHSVKERVNWCLFLLVDGASCHPLHESMLCHLPIGYCLFMLFSKVLLNSMVLLWCCHGVAIVVTSTLHAEISAHP